MARSRTRTATQKTPMKDAAGFFAHAGQSIFSILLGFLAATQLSGGAQAADAGAAVEAASFAGMNGMTTAQLLGAGLLFLATRGSMAKTVGVLALIGCGLFVALGGDFDVLAEGVKTYTNFDLNSAGAFIQTILTA